MKETHAERVKPHRSNQQLLLIIAVMAVVFSFGLHPSRKFNSWQGPLWSDGAGYFVYLPASFYFGFDANLFPENIESQMGLGFELREDGKVFTKYTYGVALMQLPVYAMIDGWVRLFEANYQPKGFTSSHQRTVLVAPILWLMLGLWWMLQWLQRRFSATASRWVIFAMFFGSHLFYYTVDSGAMSHVYSFALFAALLLLLDRLAVATDNKVIWMFGFGFLAGLILVIRPTNAIFLCFAVFCAAPSWRELQLLFAKLFAPRAAFFLFAGALLALIPQLIYWKYLSGNWVYYSYKQEGFHWLQPALLKFWFSPAGGLFLYAPIYALGAIGWWIWFKQKAMPATLFLGCFLIASYVLSCWHSWNYGGAFGGRPLVEYIVLTAPALAVYVEACQKAKPGWRITGLSVLCLFIFWNVKLSLSFNKYFFGTGDWDWHSYFQILIR